MNILVKFHCYMLQFNFFEFTGEIFVYNNFSLLKYYSFFFRVLSQFYLLCTNLNISPMKQRVWKFKPAAIEDNFFQNNSHSTVPY